MENNLVEYIESLSKVYVFWYSYFFFWGKVRNVYEYLCINMFIVILFINSKNVGMKCMLKWLNKLC